MPSLNGGLLELVQKLDGLGREPSLVALARALKGVRLTSEDVAPFVQTSPHSYQRVPVVVRDAYDLLVMTWLPGQASIPHDHAGSVCAMRVVRGEAVEGCYRVAADGYADLEYETPVRNGEVIAGQDAGVHTVRNPSGAGGVLVTVHVYAPPMKEVRQFTPRPGRTHGVRPVVPDPRPTVVVVGGGFSGSMAAAQTLRRASEAGLAVKVVVVERRGAVGEGLAYGTREPCHLLNVPAGRMSAWPDRPDHFVEWASRRYGRVGPADFLPRQWYGAYVRETLLATAHGSAGDAELAVTFDEVRRVARHPGGGWMVHLGRDPSLHAAAVVLAVGHRPPSDPMGSRWSGPRTRFVGDPWRPFATNVVGPDDPVLVLGSGLTAVDTVLALTRRPRGAPITLVSRHGLLPQAHAATPVKPVDLRPFVSGLVAAPGGVSARALLRGLRRTVRELAQAGADWRGVVDGLRPHTATLWQAMPLDQRRRFLTHLRPFWEMHRHRMASAVAGQFHALLERGDVRLLAGRVEAVRAEGDGLRVVLRERGGERPVETDASWVINCTGPMPSNRVDSNPVIGSLLVDGWLRADELALGIDTTADGTAVAEDGQAVADLFVVGTLRKPADWESTAVPELRNQAAAIAGCLVDRLSQQGRGLVQPETPNVGGQPRQAA